MVEVLWWVMKGGWRGRGGEGGGTARNWVRLARVLLGVDGCRC